MTVIRSGHMLGALSAVALVIICIFTTLASTSMSRLRQYDQEMFEG